MPEIYPSTKKQKAITKFILTGYKKKGFQSQHTINRRSKLYPGKNSVACLLKIDWFEKQPAGWVC